MNNGFKTTDTTLAAYLITQSYILLSIDYSQPRYEFRFIDSSEITDCAWQYIAGKALTDPATFNRVNRKLIRIIHKQVQWEED